jgi:hypothetical protein
MPVPRRRLAAVTSPVVTGIRAAAAIMARVRVPRLPLLAVPPPPLAVPPPPLAVPPRVLPPRPCPLRPRLAVPARPVLPVPGLARVPGHRARFPRCLALGPPRPRVLTPNVSPAALRRRPRPPLPL